MDKGEAILLSQKVEGWCSSEKASKLYDLVIESDSQLSIELGVFFGKSYIPMMFAHKIKGSGFALGVDAWNAKPCLEGTNNVENDKFWGTNVDFKKVYDACQKSIYEYGLQDFGDTLRTKSDHAGIIFADNIADIIHQDSAHNYQTIVKELQLWIPKLKVGGYWIVDDTDWVEAKEGYAKLPEFGLILIEDHGTWQIWRKVK